VRHGPIGTVASCEALTGGGTDRMTNRTQSSAPTVAGVCLWAKERMI